MANILDRYRSSTTIRHPSWRIYKAINDIQKNILPKLKKKSNSNIEDLKELSVEDFGLKKDIEIFYPYSENDDLTNEIIASLMNPDYDDNGKYGIVECMSIFCDIENRQLLEGMLMENKLVGDIAVDLGYNHETIQTYSAAFFDTSVWRSPSDKIAYLKNGTVGVDGRIKNSINKSGIDFVAAEMYNKPSKVKMESALAELFGLAYAEVRRDLSSPEDNDRDYAYKMAKILIDSFKELRNSSKQEGGIRELSIALKTDTAPKKGIEDLE